SLRWVKFVAARELPKTQDQFYKRWLLNRTAELVASRGDLPTLQWLMEIYLPLERVDNVVEVAADFGQLDMLQWLYEYQSERVHFGGCEMCGALEDKHEHVYNWLWEHTVPVANYHDKILCSVAKVGNMNVLEWLCDAYNLDASHALQSAINGCNWSAFPGSCRFIKDLASSKAKPSDTMHSAAEYTAMDMAAASGYLNVVT
ncbi:hypothetical protein PHMEG_00019944, partial [Phytophthora megakarya]